MASALSITHWIGQLKAGAPAAAEKLWEDYFRRMVELARLQLHGSPRRVLGEEGLRAVALGRMEGYTVEELAARLGCVPRTVERKLRRIRHLWEAQIPT